MTESVDDVIEYLANQIGVYGCHQEGEARTCRVCWTADVKDRLLTAVETERLLELGRQAARKERG